MRTQKKGAIVNIASDAGEIGSTFSSVDYAVSKAGVINLTRCLARTAANDGIRVNSVAPGPIDTGMMDLLQEKCGEKDFQRYLEDIPLHRLGVPRDIANVVAFLVSDEASYITGSCVDVNGGLVMR
jgi:3-oxoacyl-[acyl-carrier protein] reductase